MPDEVTNDEPTETTPSAEPPADDDKPLGESGEKALAAFKERAKASEAKAKRADVLEAELTALRESQMSEQEKAIADARKEASESARSEVLNTVNRRLFAAELKAAITGQIADTDLLSDPDVALKLLKLGEIPVTDDGDIDTEAISASVALFIEDKPHLAVSATRPGIPPLSQGPRGRVDPPDPAELPMAEYVKQRQSRRAS